MLPWLRHPSSQGMVVQWTVRNRLANVLNQLLHVSHNQLDARDVYTLRSEVFYFGSEVDPGLFVPVALACLWFDINKYSREQRHRTAAKSPSGTVRLGH
jgi:hypothetical protein